MRKFKEDKPTLKSIAGKLVDASKQLISIVPDILKIVYNLRKIARLFKRDR